MRGYICFILSANSDFASLRKSLLSLQAMTKKHLLQSDLIAVVQPDEVIPVIVIKQVGEKQGDDRCFT